MRLPDILRPVVLTSVLSIYALGLVGCASIAEAPGVEEQCPIGGVVRVQGDVESAHGAVALVDTNGDGVGDVAVLGLPPGQVNTGIVDVSARVVVVDQGKRAPDGDEICVVKVDD